MSLAIASAMPLAAQTGHPTTDSARYAARRAVAFDRLGPNLLIVQSRWAPGQWSAGFDQDASFYYFTAAERLIGAILVLDGSSRRAEVFVAKPTPGTLTELGAGVGPARAARLGVDRISDWNAFAAYIEQWLGSHPRGAMFIDEGGMGGDVVRRCTCDTVRLIGGFGQSARRICRRASQAVA